MAKEQKKVVLLTGGGGLVGSRLSEMLLDKGYAVRHLSRSKGKKPEIETFLWDISSQYIDIKALEGVDTILNLAGESLAGRRWNPKRKKEFLGSRVNGISLIKRYLSENDLSIKSFISASAIGIYGDRGRKELTEASPPGNEFISMLTSKWEEAIFSMHDLVAQVAALRIGFVLSGKGGGLPKMAQPVKMLAGAPLGTGRQIVSWIHIDDLCEMFIHLIENKTLKGAYNAVAPNPRPNKEFTKLIGTVLKRPVLLPPVPGFILRIMLGEMADMVTGGSNVSCKKIEGTGFKFRFTELEDALRDLLVS